MFKRLVFVQIIIFLLVFKIQYSFAAYAVDDFVITVQTTGAGETFTIPTDG